MVSNFTTNLTDLDNVFADRTWFQKPNTLFAWTGNLPDYIRRSSPVQLTTQSWKSITYGFGINSNGTLWALRGSNLFGQLGLNELPARTRSSPIQIGTDSNWRTVSSGNTSTSAIKTNGTLWSWGGNLNGVTGLNSTIRRSSPVQVGTDTNWSKISVSEFHVLAIRTTGTLWAWGGNGDGSGTGLNSVVARSSPTQVGTDTNWASAISAGWSWTNVTIPATTTTEYSLAIKTTGTLWAWGRGGSPVRSSPVQIGSDSNWRIAIAGKGLAGQQPTPPVASQLPNKFAIKTTGTLWAWGPNGFGTLGLNNTTEVLNTNITQVGTLSNWSDITTFDSRSALSLKTDGTLWSWGNNVGGRLGLNDTISRSSPVQVGSFTRWKLIGNVEAVLDNNSFF